MPDTRRPGAFDTSRLRGQGGYGSSSGGDGGDGGDGFRKNGDHNKKEEFDVVRNISRSQRRAALESRHVQLTESINPESEHPRLSSCYQIEISRINEWERQWERQYPDAPGRAEEAETQRTNAESVINEHKKETKQDYEALPKEHNKAILSIRYLGTYEKFLTKYESKDANRRKEWDDLIEEQRLKREHFDHVPTYSLRDPESQPPPYSGKGKERQP